MDIYSFPNTILANIGIVWTFMLVAVRYSAMMAMLPGIGGGKNGMRIRVAGILTMSYASVVAGQQVDMPDQWYSILVEASSEFLFGMLLGLVPTMLIAGVQMAGQLSATTMGLGAGALLDPTLGVSVTSLAKLLGDLTVLLFLLMGGHHVIIHAAAGLGGQIVPGTFLVGADTLSLIIDRSADIFRVGVMVSAPVIVALLLTQFVMGLISKAVPTVNIFIVSFPLTIGIGLILSGLSIPDILVFVEREVIGLENSILVLVGEATLATP
ncbi:flagellar biosynthetic protein FliR [Oligoflexia bacterium]|nr:flagellar biosynthetic protein FliR [Oligoflexia bacterium]